MGKSTSSLPSVRMRSTGVPSAAAAAGDVCAAAPEGAGRRRRVVPDGLVRRNAGVKCRVLMCGGQRMFVLAPISLAGPAKCE